MFLSLFFYKWDFIAREMGANFTKANNKKWTWPRSWGFLFSEAPCDCFHVAEALFENCLLAAVDWLITERWPDQRLDLQPSPMIRESGEIGSEMYRHKANKALKAGFVVFSTIVVVKHQWFYLIFMWPCHDKKKTIRVFLHFLGSFLLYKKKMTYIF